jgi:peptidoglycan hydrolase CwlO-like protein
MERLSKMSNAKLIMQQITELVKAYESEINTLKVKVNKITRQRDEAKGTAQEYRSYATKYQKELAELRKELRQNG